MNQEIPFLTKASGKVLIAGGYGVLEENNFGLSIALRNSIYCVCQKVLNKNQTNISVRSPQIDGQWEYKFNHENQQLYETNSNENIFVFNAILWTLLYFKNMNKAGLIVLKIISDRGFISEIDAIDSNSQYPKYKLGYKKTGLGSSACVVVSVVKCLVKIFNPKLNDQQYFRLVNIISQTANLAAQKKIGSNFDISTAVYGTHLYKNIYPRKIFPILNMQAEFQNQVNLLLETDPQIKYLPVSQDNILHGYIIDVNKGADTRVMVSGFLTRLKQHSSEIQQQFFSRSKQITLSLFQELKNFNIKKCRQINKSHRQLQRKYSKLTEVPIQPQDLTSIIDKITLIQQVCYAICPGSGGYDAIFVLAQSNIYDKLKTRIGNQHGIKEVRIQNGRDLDKQEKIDKQKIIQEFTN